MRSASARRLVPATILLALAAVASGCSLIGSTSEGVSDKPDAAGKIREVVLVTHDSFKLPKKVLAAFTAQTGYQVVTRSSGDAGELTNRLVLTTGDPTGDVAFGVDNTFAGRATSAGVFAPYDATLPAGAAQFALTGPGADTLAPIDTSAVCVNVDVAWYAAHDQRPPQSLADLVKPAYRDQLVTAGAPTSSPGFAFLLATIAAEGDAWPAYWKALMANGAELTSGWDDAYYVDYTGGGGKAATRPIVVSYDSDPAYTVDKRTGTTSTAALLDTCTRQVEYAGVLTGARNEPGAQALVAFLLGPQVQRALPSSMYVHPVRAGTPLPATWAEFAKQPTHTLDVPTAEIDRHRDAWLTEWSDITSR